MQHEEAILRYGSAKGYINACIMIFRSENYTNANIVAVVMPMHMLAGFALELYLKAWLLGAGKPSKEVKGFGHNIELLYHHSKAAGLPEVDGLEALKSHFAEPHADFTFRYIQPGDEINSTNWPLAFRIFSVLDCHVDAFLGASSSHGLAPGH